MCTTTNTDANKLWREIQISTYFRPKWIYNNRLTILQSATQSIRRIRNSSHSTAMQVMNSFVTTVPCPLRKTLLSLHDSTRALWLNKAQASSSKWWMRYLTTLTWNTPPKNQESGSASGPFIYITILLLWATLKEPGWLMQRGGWAHLHSAARSILRSCHVDNLVVHDHALRRNDHGKMTSVQCSSYQLRAVYVVVHGCQVMGHWAGSE